VGVERDPMKFIPFFAMCIVTICMCFSSYENGQRADMWHDEWKKESQKHLEDMDKMLKTDKANRTTIMRYDCILKQQTQFTRTINGILRSGNLHPVETPDIDGCMKLEAGDLEVTSASR
jgi:hypothetical protein